MSDEQAEGLNGLEAALGALAPARARMDRDRVMFLAGRASAIRAAPGRKPWIGLAAGLALVAVGEAALLARRPPAQVGEKLVVVREPAEEPAPEAVARPRDAFRSPNTDHERLMWQVLRYGLDGLPATPSTARAGREPRPGDSRQSLREELLKDFDPGDHS